MRSRRFTTKNRNSLEILIYIKAAAAAGMRNYKNLVFIEKPLFFAHFCIHVRKNSSKGPLNFWFFPDVLMCTKNNCCYWAFYPFQCMRLCLRQCACVSALHTWICQMISLHLNLKSFCIHTESYRLNQYSRVFCFRFSMLLFVT